MTPNTLVSNQGAFDASYPSDESAPRTDYLVQVLQEVVASPSGPDGNASLVDALFGWTKNEGVVQAGTQVPYQRFGYSGRDQRFKTLQGGPRDTAGQLGPDSNTERLQVAVPLIQDLVNFPIRVALGDTGSGTTFSVALVADDSSFSTPVVGEVQLSLDTGNLNWNPADLSTYEGASVHFQRQAFFQPEDSTGSLGLVGETLLLNPLPATSQLPALKFGSRSFLTVVEVPNEGAFSVNPPQGTVEWASDTGLLKLNSTDASDYAGQPLTYDGCFFGTFQVPESARGTVAAPTPLWPLPDESADTYFRVPGEVQFQETLFVDTFVTGKRGQVQVRRSDGVLQFSASDISVYGAMAVYSIVPDILIERGISLRLFRSVVSPGNTSAEAKDITAVYTKGPTDAAVLSEPIIGQPFVTLPAIPLSDYPLVVRVDQGTGSFTGSLNPLDSPTPVPGLGYVIDVDNRYLRYGERKEDVVLTPGPRDFGAVQLPNFPVFTSNLLLEEETSPGSNVYTPLVEGEDFIIDQGSAVVTFTTTQGATLVEGRGSVSGFVLTDPTVNFITENVQAGDFLAIETGDNAGVYNVVSRTTTTLTVDEAFPVPAPAVAYVVHSGKEVLVDRYFRELPEVDPNTRVEKLNSLGVATNSPRLSINPSLADRSRFRFGKTGPFSTTVQVPDDSGFTSVPAGTVQISLDTGNLNFSTSDLGATIFWARTLTFGTEYLVQPGLGFIEFTERLLALEEVVVSYVHVDDTGTKVPIVDERGTFLVPKEKTQDHPSPTSTLFFNPEGREVAAVPNPAAFRGGRPQTAEQVTFDVSNSSVTFLGDDQFTDALPHGETINPDENVYIDYFIYEALGGEQNFSVLLPPMSTTQVQIEEGGTSFTIEGDRLSDFPAQCLLQVNSDVYYLGTPTYGAGITTVTLDQSLPQAFKADYSNPRLAITSGKTRRTPSGSVPAYFTLEAADFDPVPRGSKIVRVEGDLARTYVKGTILLFSSGSKQEYALVEGSAYNEDTNRTVVALTAGVSTQYKAPVVLSRSVRPILSTPKIEAFTSSAPVLSLPHTVFRQVEGDPGVILVPEADYTIDASGKVTVFEPLGANEEVSIFYTGSVVLSGSTRLRASWSYVVVPSVSNGLLGQVLKMEYSTYIPDTFYWRVETLTNFRGEMAAQFAQDVKNSSPSQGPILENRGGQQLFEQGRPSLFFEEGHLANEDLVACPTLKFYNDAINYLEDYLQGADGRVVGDRDGRFLFDGNLNNPLRTSFSQATNQIDDYILIYGAAFTQAYQASAFSRFYPTRRRSIGNAGNPSGLVTGDPIYDTHYKPLTSVNQVQRRYPFALVTADVLSGAVVIPVDDANGNSVFIRPAFPINSKVAFFSQGGALLDDSGLTVISLTATSITLSSGVPVPLPTGSTIRLSDSDTVYRQSYMVGADLRVNTNDGLLLYVTATDIFDPPFSSKTIQANEAWDVVVDTYHNEDAPFRFPALDGLAMDDDGDCQTNPILNPSALSELAVSPNTGTPSGSGLLSRQNALLAAIPPSVIAPANLVGSLDVAGTTLTLDSGVFAVTPRAGDLVRILTGLNGSSSWVRVTAGTSTTATLEAHFVQDAAFTFNITSHSSILTGSGATVSTTGTTFTDTSKNFITSGIIPGHTIVVSSGTNNLSRRNVASVTSATTLALTAAFPSSASAFNYRIDRPLNTFGEAPLSYAGLLSQSLANQDSVLTGPTGEIPSLENYISTVGADVVSSSNGSTSGDTLTDLTEDFFTTQVSVGDYVYVRSGANFGFYDILAVPTATTITIDGSFPSVLAGMSYQILRLTGASKRGMDYVLEALGHSDAAVLDVATIQAQLAPIPVVNDAGAYANGVTLANLSARATAVSNRIAEVTLDVSNVGSILGSTDRFYDVRYAWIDGRINLSRGILVKKQRAEENREKALVRIQQDLIKLLTTT